MSTARAQQLLEFEKYPEADKELRKILTADPEDDFAHGLLSICLSSMKKVKDAHHEAELAIGLNPEIDYYYYAKSRAFIADKRFKQAEEWLLKALEIDAEESLYYTGIAHCRMNRDDYIGALEFSTIAIELDPENEDAIDIHVIILNQLGRQEDAQKLLEGSLHRNPHNDYAHANQGWAELHQNNPKQAIVHFKEALRLEPDNEYARLGLIEGIKAGNPIYRIFLMYMLWMGRLSPNVRWMIVLGGYATYRILNRLAYAQPAYANYLKPFLYLYFAFVILTWMADPIFNLLLFFHPIGKNALKEIERKACLVASIFLFAALTGCLLFFCGFHAITLLTAMFCAMMIPHVHSSFSMEEGRYKHLFQIFCLILLITGTTSLVLVYQENYFGTTLWTYNFYGWLGFMFLQMFFTTNVD